MAKAIKELFEGAVEIAGRSFPSEVAAKRGLEAFQNVLHETTPVDSVMKRVFEQASVQKVIGESGENTFKVFLRSEPAESSIATVIRGMRRADLDAVTRALKLKPGELGTNAFHKSYTNFARDIFPDVRLAEEAVKAERALPQTLTKTSRDLRPNSMDELIKAMKRDKELEKLITRLSSHIRKNGGTRFTYASMFFKITGVVGATSAVCFALHEQAKRAAGCWRVYFDPLTKKLRSCKILQASCHNKDTNEGSVCDRTPVQFTFDMCRNAEPNDECVHCDPNAETKSKHYISPSQYLEPNDLYVCKPVASVGEILGKMMADVPELAQDVVVDVGKTVAGVWHSVKYFVLAAVVIFVAILSLFVFVKFKGFGRNEYEVLEENTSSSLLDSEKSILLRDNSLL